MCMPDDSRNIDSRTAPDARERLLVCLDHGRAGAGLVRYAARQADRLRTPWTALHIETPQSARLSEDGKDRLAATMRLAEQMGAETVTLPALSPAREIIAYAHANDVGQIVVGRPGRWRWWPFRRGSVADALIRDGGDIGVHVVSADVRQDAPPQGVKNAGAPKPLRAEPYLLSVLFVLLAILAGIALDQILDVRNLALVFLMAVLAASVRGGLGAGLFASLLGALAFNFFFLDARYTFTVRDPESLVALFFYFGVALVASNLTAAVQRQAAAARQRARTTEDLYLFSKKLAGTGTLDDVLWVTAFQIASMLKVRVVILLPEAGSVAVKAGYPPDDTLADADIAAAKWAFEHNRPAGRGAETLPGARRLYLPMRTVGVIGLDDDRAGPLLTPEQQRLFDALADQAALAIERVQLVSAVDRARLAAETDRLRAALLTSISHDLKTPLAAIMGSADTLRDLGPQLDEEARRDLLLTVIDESERLNRFIANLLDMTRIGAGAMTPNHAWHFAGDLVGSALARARKIVSRHRVEVHIPDALPMLRADPVLFEQVLFNLIDNAAKYAPEDTLIEIRARQDGETIVIAVGDEGPGIPPGDIERIFDSFYRVEKGDHVRAGTGLGLAICRGFVEAMGGAITAANRVGRPGAVFTIRMPLPAERPALGENQ